MSFGDLRRLSGVRRLVEREIDVCEDLAPELFPARDGGWLVALRVEVVREHECRSAVSPVEGVRRHRESGRVVSRDDAIEVWVGAVVEESLASVHKGWHVCVLEDRR